MECVGLHVLLYVDLCYQINELNPYLFLGGLTI
jgi:hypothetical protein